MPLDIITPPVYLRMLGAVLNSKQLSLNGQEVAVPQSMTAVRGTRVLTFSPFLAKYY